MHLFKKAEKTAITKDIHHLSNDDKIIWLMEEYGDMVIRVAYTYVKQKQLAEDISQEVFISCFKNLDEFQQKSSYKTWLYRITVNKCKDVLRSWSFRNLQYKDFFGSMIRSSDKPAEIQLIHQEDNSELFQKVLSLPIKLREVIILYYYEELSIDDIASLLGLNANTVKTRLHRGRNSLKTSLKGRDFL